MWVQCAISMLVTILALEVHYAWERYHSIVTCTLVGMMYLMICLESFATYLFMQCFLLLYFAISTPFLESDHKSFRSLKEIMTYKSTTLICDMMNEKYFYYIIPTIKWGFTWVSMGSIVIAIRLNHVNTDGSAILQLGSCVIGIYAMVGTVIGATLLSQQYHSSLDWLWRFKHKPAEWNKLEYNKMVLKSLRPLKIQIGGLYYMESEAKLTLTDFIISGTVDLLLMFK